jgi:hypothetical protein
MSWNIKTPGDYINGPLTVAGNTTITGDLTVDTSTLKVDSTNNRVGILTASPRSGFALDVLGYVAIGSSTTTGSVPLTIDCLGAAGNVASIQFRSANVVKAYFGLSGSFMGDTSTDAMVATDAAGAGIRFFVADTGVEAMRLNSTANLVLKGGTVGANGVGVTFPATQVASSDANCLDDYEEGTFTPTVIGTTTAGTATYASQVGRYTKVGRVVQFQIDINYSAGTGTGNLQIDGLPFQNSSGLAAISTYPINIALGALYYAVGLVGTNGTKIDINQLPTGGGNDAVVNYDGAGRIILSGTYIV